MNQNQLETMEPGFFVSYTQQVVCPGGNVRLDVAKTFSDTTSLNYQFGSVMVEKSGLYNLQFNILVNQISSTLAQCPNPAPVQPGTPASQVCGNPCVSLSIDNIPLTDIIYSANSVGQITGIALLSLLEGQMVNIINASNCPVLLGTNTPNAFLQNTQSTTLFPQYNPCSTMGNVISASLILEYKGSLKDESCSRVPRLNRCNRHKHDSVCSCPTPRFRPLTFGQF